mmetsp:Transcript_7539/g.18712  ORF Transcript_7539/g.18712 Transcript_7539/m.18712 type:complete len:85 (+) Transcript_7539:1160-1414(+)
MQIILKVEVHVLLHLKASCNEVITYFSILSINCLDSIGTQYHVYSSSLSSSEDESSTRNVAIRLVFTINSSSPYGSSKTIPLSS